MEHLHIETPLFASRPLTLRSGKEIWLKFESMQPTGSFKIRGIGQACQSFVRQGAKRFISSSGGNAGIAAAYAGRLLSVPVVVVVPETTTNRAKRLIQNEGAEVIVHGKSWQEANTMALSMLNETDYFWWSYAEGQQQPSRNYNSGQRVLYNKRMPPETPIAALTVCR